MDPASASVAAVGFSASIITIAGVAAQSLRMVHNLWTQLKDAPENCQRLMRTLENLGALATLLARQDQAFAYRGAPPEQRQLWDQVAAQLASVLGKLKDEVSGVEARLQAGSVSKRQVRLRILDFFSQDSVQKYERVLAEQVQLLTLTLSLSTSSQTSVILSQHNQTTTMLSGIHNAVTEMKASQNSRDESLARGLSVLASSSQKSVIQLSRRVELLESGLLSGHDVMHTLKLQKYQARSVCSRSKQDYPTSKLLDWRWSVHSLPVGTLAIGRAERRASDESNAAADEDAVRFQEIELLYHPPAWVSNEIVKLKRQAKYDGYGNAGLTYSLMSQCHNSNPLLVEAIYTGDIARLQQLFSQRLARPTDLITPNGRSLLQECIFTYAAGNTAALDACQFLLNQGADINARGLDGRTPLLLCCTLMQNPWRERQLQVMATWFLENGGELTSVDPNGDTACSLIFRAPHGIEYLQSHVSGLVDVVALYQAASSDALIFSAIARSRPQFGFRLRKQLEEFSTPPALSSRPRRATPDLGILFDEQQQRAAVQDAGKAFRVQLLRGICRQGDTTMLAPLLQANLDLEERVNDGPSYLEEAARAGNFATAQMLLAAGARIHGEWSALDVIFERWKSFDRARIRDEWPLFELLTEHVRVRCPNALTRSVGGGFDYCTRRLLEKGFAPRSAEDRVLGELDILNGSEVMEAVKRERVEALKMLIEHGAGLEFEDRNGVTPLILALDKGHPALVRALIQGGARCLQQTSAKLTAWDVAQGNCHASHPRKSSFVRDDYSKPLDISYDTDLDMYQLIDQAQEAERGRAMGTGSGGSWLPQLRPMWSQDPATQPHDHPATQMIRKVVREYQDFYDWLINVPIGEIVLGNLLLVLLFIFYSSYRVISRLLWPLLRRAFVFRVGGRPRR